MKNLIICGKANMEIPVRKLKSSKNDEVWLCGTDTREGADLYFEIHGLKVPHEKVVTKFEHEIYHNESGLSPSNSISGMLIYAWLKGYTNITLLGCPMLIKEYPQHRETVVRLVHFLNAKGLNVRWDDIDLKPEDVKKEPEQKPFVKTVKARVLQLICASFGTFDAGMIADIPEENLPELLQEGIVEQIK